MSEDAPSGNTLRSFFIAGVVLSCLLMMVPVFAGEQKISTSMRVRFSDVVEKAKGLAAHPFEAPHKNIPQALKDIGYDQWRDIRFNLSKSLWAQAPFSVQFFHPGFLYQDPVIIHYIDGSGTHRMPFTPDLFDHAKEDLKGILKEDVGFAGFRVHYPLNTPKYSDELVSFLGASYFRALGRDLFYGLSARGLAVNTAEDIGEEFPLFREFWIVRPEPGAKTLKIYALLDSESLAGAYEFTIRPGQETLIQVKSTLFIRKDVRKLGIAPLTSMFFYGECSGPDKNADFRPEVHDSDGLLIHGRNGEWIWHPLVNPDRLLINSFSGERPIGFGLLQRDVNFDHYQDLEARYDRRPSLWVIPENDWGRGHVELIQIPTPNEYNDNIVASWVPERPFEPGDVLTYAYTLVWHAADLRRHPKGYVEATRIVKKEDRVMFFVDFVGDALKGLAVDKVLQPHIEINEGYSLIASQVMKNVVSGGWRVVLELKGDKPGLLEGVLPGQPAPLEMRVFLKDGKVPVTETWSYTYQQGQP